MLSRVDSTGQEGHKVTGGRTDKPSRHCPQQGIGYTDRARSIPLIGKTSGFAVTPPFATNH